jgi:hypothetical protein
VKVELFFLHREFVRPPPRAAVRSHGALRGIVRGVRAALPFTIDAMVELPDH